MSHFTSEEDVLMAENVGIKNYEVGARRRGRIGIPSHSRSWPGNPPGYPEVDVEAHSRRYPDVGAEPTKIRSFVKDGKVCIVMLCEGPAGEKLMLGTCAPLPHGGHPDAFTMGWSPWGSIKKAAKGLGKTVKYGASKLYQVAKSPEFQSLAMQAAPAALSAFGVPPGITQKAIGVVQRGRQGDPEAVAKVARIRSLAQQQYPPAQQLYGVMSAYYRGGVPGLMQAPPHVPRYPSYPMPSPYGYGMQQAPSPWGGPPQLPYGMHPFAIPTPGYGTVSGWLYNMPMRSNVQAALESPLLKARGAYQRGMVGAMLENEAQGVGIKDYEIGRRRRGRIGIPRHTRSWPGGEEDTEVMVEAHERRYPDVH